VVPVVAEMEDHQAQVLEELELKAAEEAAVQAVDLQEMVAPVEVE
jgi:hypothetical protein